MKKYYPIVMAKKGDLDALSHLEHSSKFDICPILQITDDMLDKSEFAKKEKGEPRTGKRIKVGSTYNDRIERFLKTHWGFEGNCIIFDFSLFDNIKSKIFEISRLIDNVYQNGINLILSIQQNSEEVYLDFVKEQFKIKNIKICLRISNNSGGFRGVNKVLSSLLSRIGAIESKSIVLIDLGYVIEEQLQTSILTGDSSIRLIEDMKWLDIIIASGSFPKDLSEFKAGESKSILRHEWSIWEELKKDFSNIRYGDYGTRHPIYMKSNDSFEGSISVRYTWNNEFVVYRGSKASIHSNGYGQFISHSISIVNSRYFYGPQFSFGDCTIDEVSKRPMPPKGEKAGVGNTTNWVQNCQNHHFELMLNML